MVKVRVDTSVADSGDGQFKEWVPGTYTCVIDKIEEKEGPKAPFLAVDMRVIEGEYEDYHIFDNVTLSENAAWRAATFFKNLGVVTDGEEEIDTDELVSRPVKVRCDVEEYERTVRPKVKRYIMHEDVRAFMESESAPVEKKETSSTGGKKSFKLS